MDHKRKYIHNIRVSECYEYIVKFSYTIDAFLNIAILTLSMQITFPIVYMWKALLIKGRMEQQSETLRILGEVLFAYSRLMAFISQKDDGGNS